MNFQSLFPFIIAASCYGQYVVTSGSDSAVSTGGAPDTSAPYQGDLRWCINQILNQQAQGNLTGGGNWTIGFSSSVDTVALQDALSVLNLFSPDTLTIGNDPNGNPNGEVTINGHGHRGFIVRQGDVTLQNLTLSSTQTTGGAGARSGGGGGGLGGGLLVVGGNVTLKGVSFESCQATGGAGDTTGSDGGGGGGLEGSGNTAGGGGGIRGNGNFGGGGAGGAGGMLGGGGGAIIGVDGNDGSGGSLGDYVFGGGGPCTWVPLG